jgi:hypothetical protein
LHFDFDFSKGEKKRGEGGTHMYLISSLEEEDTRETRIISTMEISSFNTSQNIIFQKSSYNKNRPIIIA